MTKSKPHLPWLTFHFMMVNFLLLLTYLYIQLILTFEIFIFSVVGLLLSFLIIVHILGIVHILSRIISNTLVVFLDAHSITVQKLLIPYRINYPWKALKGFTTSRRFNFNIIVFYPVKEAPFIISQVSVWDFQQFQYQLKNYPIEYLGREKYKYSRLLSSIFGKN
ncbi:MAG TPA: hypothetical protein ACFCUD_05875 [Cyclobacteriaceae bacterium]